MEVLETDSWGFQAVGPETGVKVVDAFDKIPPVPLSMLSVSPGDDQSAIFAAAGPSQVVTGKVANLYETLMGRSELVTTSFLVQTPVFVQILANGSQIAVYTEAGELSLRTLDGTVLWTHNVSSLTQLERDPTGAAIYFVAEGSAHVVTAQGVQSIGPATKLAIHAKGQYALATPQGIQYGDQLIRLPGEGVVSHLSFIKDSIFCVVGEGAEYTPYLYTTDWQEVTDACPPYGDESRFLVWYSGYAEWSEDIFVVAASVASDVSLASTKQVLSPQEDSSRAMMPFTDAETSPIGAALYSGSNVAPEKVFNGHKLSHPTPIWYLLTNEGSVVAWRVVSRDAAEGPPPKVSSLVTATLQPTAEPLGVDVESKLEEAKPNDMAADSKDTKSNESPKSQPPTDFKPTFGRSTTGAGLSFGGSSVFGNINTTFGSSWGKSDTFGSSSVAVEPTMQLATSQSTNSEPQATSGAVKFGAQPGSIFGNSSAPTQQSSSGSLAFASSFGAPSKESPFAQLKGANIFSSDAGDNKGTSAKEKKESGSVFAKVSAQPASGKEQIESNFGGFSLNNEKFGQVKSPGTVPTGNKPALNSDSKTLFGQSNKSPFGFQANPKSNSSQLFPLGNKESTQGFGTPTETKPSSAFGSGLSGSAFAPKSNSTAPSGEANNAPTGAEPRRNFFETRTDKHESPFAKLSSRAGSDKADDLSDTLGNSFTLSTPKNGTAESKTARPQSSLAQRLQPRQGQLEEAGGSGEEWEEESEEYTDESDEETEEENSEEETDEESEGDFDEESEEDAREESDEAEVRSPEKPVSESQNEQEKFRFREKSKAPAIPQPETKTAASPSFSLPKSGSGSLLFQKGKQKQEQIGEDLFPSKQREEPAQPVTAESSAPDNEPVTSEPSDDSNDVTFSLVEPDTVELLPFDVEPSKLTNIDGIYADTNKLFQVVDFNLKILEKAVQKANEHESTVPSGQRDLLDFESWSVKDVAELSSRLDEVASRVKTERLTDLDCEQSAQLKQSIERSRLDVNEIGEALSHLKHDFGPESQRLRPLPLRAARLQQEIREKRSSIGEQLFKAESALLELRAKKNPPSTADLNITVDLLEKQLNRMSAARDVLTSQNPAFSADVTAYSLSLLGLDERDNDDDEFHERRKFHEQVTAFGTLLRAQSSGH